MRADEYINSIGGVELYDSIFFKERGLKLRFIKTKPFEYAQFSEPFIPWLSIIDVLMFNPIPDVIEYINFNYEVI